MNFRLIFLLFCVFSVLVMPPKALAKKTIVPEKLEQVTVVSALELSAMISDFEARGASRSLMIVDTRRQLEFFEEHIPGAVLIPYKESSQKSIKFNPRKDSFDLTLVEHSSAEHVVFYCNGPDCWRSYKACVWARKAKIRQKIYWFRDGLPAWKAQNLKTAAGKK